MVAQLKQLNSEHCYWFVFGVGNGETVSRLDLIVLIVSFVSCAMVVIKLRVALFVLMARSRPKSTESG